jgi:hypothetical protein
MRERCNGATTIYIDRHDMGSVRPMYVVLKPCTTICKSLTEICNADESYTPQQGFNEAVTGHWPPRKSSILR